jgi:SSS family solute:Na+ symporter
LPLGIALSVIFAGLYTAAGGLRAVVATDMFQCGLMFAGVITLAVYSYLRYGHWSEFVSALPDHYWRWDGQQSMGTLLMWLIIACSSTWLSPALYERTLAAQSDRVARWGILLSIPLWLIFDLAVLIGALYARALMPQAPSAQAYLLYGLQVLPAGLRGLLLASVMATLLSTLDSLLFVSGSIVSGDLLRQRQNPATWARWATLAVVCALSILCAQVFDRNLEAMRLFTKRYFLSSLLFPMLWVYLFPGYAGARRFWWSAGSAALTVAFCSGKPWLGGLDPLYPGMAASLTTILILSLWEKVSGAGRPQAP